MTQIIPVSSFDYVVFGGTGDLSFRKLLPALYNRFRDGQFAGDSRIIGLSRADISTAAYLEQVHTALRTFTPGATWDEDVWRDFSVIISHMTLDVQGAAGWAALADLVRSSPREVPVFYLATNPTLFGLICQKLQAHDMVTARSRVVLEKPLGHDRQSAQAINAEVAEIFTEQQTFRIDHYLGKETVQNLMVLRFANAMFEPLWSHHWVDHVQITVAETLGVAQRLGYYDGMGAMRDMVQNHLLQLLCLIAMEPPHLFQADLVRDEKLKVLRALKPLTGADAGRATVRGQYVAGRMDGQDVLGYQQEAGYGSPTETFVALRAEVDNWRWAGVPFYLRTGKRLPAKASEIVIQFKAVPHNVFTGDAATMPLQANHLLVRLQPDEGIQLYLMSKDPGPGGLRFRKTALNLSFADVFDIRFPDAYERLLMDVVRGNLTLFMRRDEVDAAWRWVDPILTAWAQQGGQPDPYQAGVWGPPSAARLIERDGRAWHDPAYDQDIKNHQGKDHLEGMI